jgi:hypothetical protein
MKNLLKTIIILCTAGASSLHAYTNQTVTNTVQSFIDGPGYYSLQGETLASPLSQYGATWTGEAVLATNGTFTGKGMIISFANGATNSTKDSFSLISPSLIKGPVILERYIPTTNSEVYQNYYGPNNVSIIYSTNKNINTKYVYSADCILTATNSSTRFLLKGRALYEVTENKFISPKVVIPTWVETNGGYTYTNGGWTNPSYTNIYTNTSVTLSLAAFSTNNAFWGFISGFNN